MASTAAAISDKLAERQAQATRSQQNVLDRGKMVQAFECSFRGSELVDDVRGVAIVTAVVNSLAAKNKKKNRSEPVVVNVTSKGIYVDEKFDKKKGTGVLIKKARVHPEREPPARVGVAPPPPLNNRRHWRCCYRLTCARSPLSR